MTIKEMKELALCAAKNEAPANYSMENVNDALVEALREMAGSVNQFMKNRYDIYEIIIEAADEVDPKKVIDAVGIFADVQQVGQGQKALFRTKLGRTRARKFLTQVGLSGVYETFRLDHGYFELSGHAIGGACTIDFERMLDGAENMADLVSLLTEAQSTVRAYGSGAVIFAPPEFVAAMGADEIAPVPANGAYGVYHPQDIDAIHNTGYINLFRGTPIVQIPQSFIDENNEETWIDPQLAYVLPTGGEKVVKVVFEGQTQMYDFVNRDQSMEIHTYRKLGTAILTYHNWAIYKNTGIPQTYAETLQYI